MKDKACGARHAGHGMQDTACRTWQAGRAGECNDRGKAVTEDKSGRAKQTGMQGKAGRARDCKTEQCRQAGKAERQGNAGWQAGRHGKAGRAVGQSRHAG
jgi:hypothetical protein